MTILKFPKDFLWGVATSSYQIEGAYKEDERGESIWDRFSHTPGKTLNGETGDMACDHYHLWRDDIKLMKQLGIQAYRFSIAWPRILPQGRGRLNEAGIDFYSQLVDGLLEAGIIPFVTLYHWDLPQVLQEEGGWTARSTAELFANYADVISRALGDRVKNWITHNEPWCASFLSYQIGEHAPGHINDWLGAIQASHHLLLSHGWSVPLIRRNAPGAEVGITLNFSPAYPASSSAPDHDAARYHDGYANRWFTDPLFGRHYPADMIHDYTQAGYLPNGLSFIKGGDMQTIAAQMDFLGVNYYTRAIIRGSEKGNVPQTLFPEKEHTEMAWEVYPDGLYHLVNQLYFEYRPPKMYITENGASYGDAPNGNGRVADLKRIRYLRDHIAMTHRVLQNGVPLAGYFEWSLLDNFEWAKGYNQRFGIVWVDYRTQKRTPKDSAYWYRDVIKRRELNLNEKARRAKPKKRRAKK
jgi:beta-glucosidase